MGTVYLIHFLTPYRHARHYLGYSASLSQRQAQHMTGNGARLLQVIGEAGISWSVVRTWAGNRSAERRLKNSTTARICVQFVTRTIIETES